MNYKKELDKLSIEFKAKHDLFLARVRLWGRDAMHSKDPKQFNKVLKVNSLLLDGELMKATYTLNKLRLNL